MAEQKKAMLFAHSMLEQTKGLTDEQTGKLFRALIQYDMDGVEPGADADAVTKALFGVYKTHADENKKRFAETCERNKENARKRWAQDMEPPPLPEEMQGQPEQMPSNTTACHRMPSDTKNADSDSDSVSLSVQYYNKTTTDACTGDDDLSFIRLLPRYHKQTAMAVRATVKKLYSEYFNFYDKGKNPREQTANEVVTVITGVWLRLKDGGILKFNKKTYYADEFDKIVCELARNRCAKFDKLVFTLDDRLDIDDREPYILGTVIQMGSKPSRNKPPPGG